MSVFRRPNARVLRHQEQRELARRQGERANQDEAHDRLVTGLRDARMAALELRQVILAAEIGQLLELAERPRP